MLYSRCTVVLQYCKAVIQLEKISLKINIGVPKGDADVYREAYMPKSANQKLKLLYLMQLLLQISDEAHPLSVQQMIGMAIAMGEDNSVLEFELNDR